MLFSANVGVLVFYDRAKVWLIASREETPYILQRKQTLDTQFK